MAAGEAVIVQSAGAWADQGHRAFQALSAKLPPGARPELRELDAVDHDLFATLIEALVALQEVTGVAVADELVELAGLRPAAKVLGLP
jgi:hypothetical protein